MIAGLGVILCGLTLIAITVAYSLALGISPMPTSSAVKQSLLKQLPRHSGPIYELGSGWGSLLKPLACAYPTSDIYAFELSPLPYLISTLRMALSPLSNVHLARKNFFKISLSDARLVICYLYPGAMRSLAAKCASELPKGAIVISHTFALPGHTAKRVDHASDAYRTPIYVYQF